MFISMYLAYFLLWSSYGVGTMAGYSNCKKILWFIKHLFHHLPYFITGVMSTQRRTIKDLDDQM